MANLNRRLRHLESRVQGDEGLVPYTEAWMNFYLEILTRRINGEEIPVGTKIPLEFFHACRLHKEDQHDELARYAREYMMGMHKRRR